MAGDSLVVRSRLKEIVNKYGKDKVTNISGDFAQKLSQEVEELISKAVKRAEDNGRRTVQARDI